ncbi:oligoendopeptidase F [Alkalicella caledoniensis]|uniref:Oligopeptidase F n=1 Tax=Alkalicella caledoniensis TaxID=2731377 RepID=A0A7G9W759_ALKCA|nr:oligoendopeptidase F [Alkalicella caledoniensis]QNO14521.1 oligoendopeptidase F [Alkalicella caledoniensis]
MPKVVPFRNEVEDQHKWAVDEIYQSIADWEKDYHKVTELLNRILPLKGNLKHAAKLYQCLTLQDELSELLGKVHVYVALKRDEDTNHTENQSNVQRAEDLLLNVKTELSFINPEILSFTTETINRLFEEQPKLKFYRFYLEEILRLKPHTLSPREEQLLSMSQDLNKGPQSTFSMLNNADIKFPTIVDEDDNEVELSHGRYIQFLTSNNRRVRKEAYEAMYTTFGQYKNTIASTLGTRIKGNIFYSKARNYESALKQELHPDNIPTVVYENVVNTINKNLEPLHRYVSIKKRLLGVDDLMMYDIYAPLIGDFTMDISYDEAKDLVIKGCKKLGEEYVSILKEGMETGWVDVYENRGKRSGAYSWGSYGTKPYILMNYDNTLNSTYTLAHEFGHSIHTYLSHKNQPYTYSHYNIFAAEVASTVNEALLSDYLLETTDDKKKRFYIINQYLEGIRGTVYRQGMFAEFELEVHKLAQEGKPLIHKTFSDIWLNLNKKYFGPELVVDDLIGMEWARIPHFYTSFYVFKYVTGFSAATTLAQNIIEQGQPAVDKYLSFLKGGGSDYVINLLKQAGVDMTKPEPIEKTLKLFDSLLDELEKLV